ncbi:hypothetical protein ABG067_003496 [Albugo candida]
MAVKECCVMSPDILTEEVAIQYSNCIKTFDIQFNINHAMETVVAACWVRTNIEPPYRSVYMGSFYWKFGAILNKVLIPCNQRLRGATRPTQQNIQNLYSSSDSDSDGEERNEFKIGHAGAPIRWGGDDWTFYKHVMMNAFEESLFDQIAIGEKSEDKSWDDDEKEESKKTGQNQNPDSRITFNETCKTSDDEEYRHGDVG